MSNTTRMQYLDLKKDSLGDRYEICFKNAAVDVLGEGGSGVVVLAHQIFDKENQIIAERAVKFFVFRDDLMTEDEVISKSNFLIEIKNITRFNHQNILKVIDGNYYEPSSHLNVKIPYIVTEYIEGMNFEELLAKENIEKSKEVISNQESVFELLAGIIDGVEYLHAHGFYHCDIAPKNIFIMKHPKSNKCFPIIGDLGAGFTKNKGKRSDKKIKVIGTYNYMPSNVAEVKGEEILSEKYEGFQPHWDVYSLIVTIQEIIDKVINSKLTGGQVACLEQLRSKVSKENAHNLGALREAIEFCRPSSTQILKIDELSEANVNINSIMLPCYTVMISNKMRSIAKHPMMLRLMDVSQLLEGAVTFPGANHTRYEHSLGTYELMRRALVVLLRNRDYSIYLSERDVTLGLLSALLSSITCFQYSYIIEELKSQDSTLFAKFDKRDIFKMILKKTVGSSSLSSLIDSYFKSYKIEISELSYIIFGREGEKRDNLDALHILLNSLFGVRIVDYLIRDAYHTGIGCNIDIEALFQSFSIVDNEFRIKQTGLSALEQVTANREWMFKRVYWCDPNRANAALLKYAFYLAYNADKKHSFEQYIMNNVTSLDKDTIKNVILKKSEHKEIVTQIFDFINLKGEKTYRRVLAINRDSNYSNASRVFNMFSDMSYSNQCDIREKLEKNLKVKYGIDDDTCALPVIIDLPTKISKENLRVKLQRYNGLASSLDNASKLIDGTFANYDEQIRLLRVYVHPDIYNKYFSKIKNEDIEKNLVEELDKIIPGN